MAKTTYRLVEVPFSKTECGVDFFINTAHGSERRGVLTEYPVFKTDFFEMFFFRKANGYLLLGYQKIELRDGMVLILKPHQQQEWHIDEDALDYDFLIFRNDFMRTFIADKFFVYRLQYCQQTDTPPYFMATADELTEYERLLKKIRSELRQPVADSYHIIVSVLYYLLAVLNRRYTETYSLPFELPKNHYAFSRVTLNQSVMAQYGVPATVLLKQRLLAEIKNGLLFSHKTVSEIAYDFHFSEPSHLMRFFKKSTGKTCTQFQQEYENGTFE